MSTADSTGIAPPPPPLGGTMVLMHGRLVDFGQELAGFAADHASWYDHFPSDEPLYALPTSVISRMETSGPQRVAAMDSATAQAERSFTRLCLAAGAVGTWSGRPIVYPWLLSSLPPPTAALILRTWDDPKMVFQFQQAFEELDRIRPNLAGYAGRLMTDPAFVAARDALRVRWRMLPWDLRLSFPLSGAAEVPRPGDNLDSDRTGLGRFLIELHRFLADWELLGLATWDLPLPRGPLLPDPRPSGPRGRLLLDLPAWFPFEGSDGLAAELRYLRPQGQIQLDHAALYASMLGVDFIERAMIARAPDPARPPPGWVKLVIDALADALEISPEHARALRKAISACRRGHRDSVPILRKRNLRKRKRA
jgi:hypothetical protein